LEAVAPDAPEALGEDEALSVSFMAVLVSKLDRKAELNRPHGLNPKRGQ